MSDTKNKLAENKLERALEAGVLSREQLDAINALDQVDTENNIAKDDEPFQLFGGFGEVLISIGLFILMMAIGNIGGFLPLVIIAIALSFYFVKMRKLTLPGIILSGTMFYGMIGISVEYIGEFSLLIALVASLLITAIVTVYYYVFRLPFALYLLAWAITVDVLILLGLYYDDQFFAFFFDLRWLPLAITFVLGSAAVLGGLFFDFQDPERNKIQTQKAFWLHVFAAPLLLWPWVARFFILETTSAAIIAFFGISLLAIVGIILDRRSFVTVGLLSFGSLLVYFFGEDFSNFGVILLIVGAYALVIGTWWKTIRKGIMRLFPNGRLKARLPA